MCGIIGATGETDVLPLLLDGLGRLEYRGYDSAGVALQANGSIWRVRAAAGTHSLADLQRFVESAPTGSAAGIGHTRWATHGRPSEVNAHPHTDCSGQVAVVHNGIVENWRELAALLVERGHVFTSDTDTEVIAHLVEEGIADGASLADALRSTLKKVRGTYAIVAVSSAEPGTLVAARRVSPLVVGLARPAAVGTTCGGPGPIGSGCGLVMVASDIPALLGVADRFLLLGDDEVVELRAGSLQATNLDGESAVMAEMSVAWDLAAAEKGGYDDFMSKEIHEQPQALTDTLLGRLREDATFELDALKIGPSEAAAIDKILVVACGSSYHAGLVARFALEKWARIPTEVDIASELRYRGPILDDRTLVVGVSQSGETIDTLEALAEARRAGARVVAVSNVVDSSMARSADGVLYTRAGPEVGVAATKTHLTQITALELLALHLARVREQLGAGEIRELYGAMCATPDRVEETLARSEEVAGVATRFASSRDFFFLGRHVSYPVALEGALKLKEISYVRAEAYPAGELKHGPIALIEPGSVVVAIATRTALWEKMMSNVAEVRSRGAAVILVVNDGDEESAAAADAVLWVPGTHELLSPLVDVLPLQLFAYHLARHHGLDVDRPRNLAKTVTVE